MTRSELHHDHRIPKAHTCPAQRPRDAKNARGACHSCWWLGLREDLHEEPIFSGKIDGFRLRFSPEPIHWSWWWWWWWWWWGWWWWWRWWWWWWWCWCWCCCWWRRWWRRRNHGLFRPNQLQQQWNTNPEQFQQPGVFYSILWLVPLQGRFISRSVHTSKSPKILGS